jgi:transposase
MRKKGSPEQWDQKRKTAAKLFGQMEPKEIAKVLEVDPQTVRHWRRLYLRSGLRALASRKPSGRPRKLTWEQKLQLLEMLRLPPRDFGMDSFLWTTRLIAKLVLNQFGVSHHHDHIGVLLHELGWSPQVPARRAKERDEKRIDLWRRAFWPDLLKKVGPKAAPL